MLCLRLLAVVLIMTNTWLLNSAQSDHIRRYKRAMAQRADNELAHLASEQCRSTRQQRLPTYSASALHLPPVAHPRRYTSRLRGVYHRTPFVESSCSGGCNLKTNSHPGLHAISHWVDGETKFSQGNSEAVLPKDKEQRHARSMGMVSSLPDSRKKSWAEGTVDSNHDSDEAEVDGGPSKGPQQQQLFKNQKRDLTGSSNLHRKVRRSLAVSHDGDSWAAFPGGVINSRGILSKFQQHSDYSAEDFSGEREGPPSHSPASTLWGAQIPDTPKWMSALYFNGEKKQLRVNPAAGIELPQAKFSLELWVKPEGGQTNPAIIAGVFDNCSHSLSEKGWSIGIQTVESGGRKDARFFFTVRTDRAPKATTIFGHQRYHANSWTHLMASYNGLKMTLYVDGAKVAESALQSGDLCSPFMQTCRTLLLGGDRSDLGHNFRGHVGGVALWGLPRTHRDLREGPPRIDKGEPRLALWADFSKVEQLLSPRKEGFHPSIVSIPTPEREHVSPFLPPPCGLTACDNADIILSYNHRWQLRAEKRLRYRVVNICDDDGGRPTVSRDQVRAQHEALVRAFRPYNLSLEVSVHAVRNTSLRQRLVLGSCRVSRIGNRHCDPECDHPLTGHDGGDCLRPGPCYNWKRRDGACDAECNSIHYDYDDGDCCDPEVADTTRTCFDPESPNRAYMSVKELKELLKLSSKDTLNIFFANNSAREELAGSATWPWAKEALHHQGGIVLNPSHFGTTGRSNTMIHEMGHIFGLYHVFKGVSERESCDDPCRETEASLETGDLCADTAPTPKWKACHDPGSVSDSCGTAVYRDTPYSNYMSYADDNCTNHFTPNQVARMHCYVDLVYEDWLNDRMPTPIPLKPMVIGQSTDSVTIHWLPPVRGPLHKSSSTVDGVNCRDCDTDRVFHQYACEATSPRLCDSDGYWTPEEAIGRPDVHQPCEPSLQAWSPELSLYDANVTSPCPETEGCVLMLRFLHPVVADSLTAWITYTSAADAQASVKVELITEADEVVDMGPQRVFCDMPLTLRVDARDRVAAVRLSTFDEKMEIDAVMLSSGPGNLLCSGCRPLIYRLVRRPAFSDSLVRQTSLTFTDSDILEDVEYEYRVQVEAGGVLSELSPPLLYRRGVAYCGDGLLQGTEDCDDGNLLDGDGCSKKCHMESGFNCNGEPSLCYVYEGDGVCEDFEKGASVQDCGYYTPYGYNDQWASTAAASHQDQGRCPALAATGEPSLGKLCKPQYLEMNGKPSHDTWVPCTAQSYTQTYKDEEDTVWLKVGFAQPGVAASVIIYLASDGAWPEEHSRRTVFLQLSDTAGRNHSLGTYKLSCQQNPLVVNVTHNLSQPFFLTTAVLLNFSSPLVAVTAVALRTACHFSAFALHGCLRHPCLTDTCGPPQLEHASVTRSPGSERSDTSHCTVRCHPGFSLTTLSGQGHPPFQQQTELQCVHGAWDRIVSCQPIDCGLPDQSHVSYAVFSCPWGTTVGKHCSFTCSSPAILQGDNDRLVCLDDGLWSFPEAYCKIECPEPPTVPHAKLLVPRCDSTGHDVGTVCRYRCNPGYYVTGNQNTKSKRFLKVECLEGGEWEEGGCEPVSCPSLPAVFEGMYTCTDGLHYNSLCTLQCPRASENLTIRCTKEGKWTEEFTMCSRLEGGCPPPTDVNQVQYTCDQGFSVGALCYLTCSAALHDPVVLASGTTADNVEHWMLPQRVRDIVCTGMMKWHPDPTRIHCIQSCEPFGGDGWCDTINNRAHCKYDGGDCCPSTLSTRKVIQFGADCDQDECTCRDPSAEENKSKATFLEAGLL